MREIWSRKPLGEVATLQRGFDLPLQLRQAGSVPVISSGGHSGSHSKAMVKGPGVIMGRYGTIGKIHFVNEDFWPLNTTLWVKNFHGNVEKYVYYLLSSLDFTNFKDKTGVPGVNRNDLHKIKMYVAPMREQASIVEVLSVWDDAVDRVQRLIDAKKRYIRGMLSACVSDARKTIKSDGWETTAIGEVATLVQQRVTWDEDATYRLITVRRGCGGLVFRGDRKGQEILTKDMYTVRAGDFLISKRQVVHGAWAMVLPEFDGAHVSKEYACLRAKPDKLWMPYFDWLSRTERLQHEAFICSYGVDIEKMVLNVEWLLQTPLLLPRSIETQKAMAAGLDCLQREVQLLQAQMEALGRQKRGLMQKLLTGEWRVPVRDRDVDAIAARVTEEAAQ